MGWVLMSEREVHRIEVLSGVVAGRMSTSEAASVLCLSDRQVQRLLKTFREDGAVALRHKARGRPSNTRIVIRGAKPKCTCWINGLLVASIDLGQMQFPNYDSMAAFLGPKGHIAFKVHDNDWGGLGQGRWSRLLLAQHPHQGCFDHDTLGHPRAGLHRRALCRRPGPGGGAADRRRLAPSSPGAGLRGQTWGPARPWVPRGPGRGPGGRCGLCRLAAQPPPRTRPPAADGGRLRASNRGHGGAASS